MYKASKDLLPANIQNLFSKREGGYTLRGCSKLKVPAFRTTRKRFCVSVCGVRLWNGLGAQLQHCSTIYQFKSMYKKTLLLKYSTEEGF